MLMVKPGMAYLDVVRMIKQKVSDCYFETGQLVYITSLVMF